MYRRLARRARRIHGRGPVLVAFGDSLTDPHCGYTLAGQVWLRIVGHRRGYRTVNLGVSGDTTADMSARVEEALTAGPPAMAVVFGGANDAMNGLDPGETERNVVAMVGWLRCNGVPKIALISPGIVNSRHELEWARAAEEVGEVLRRVASQHEAVFVDLAAFLHERLESGKDPDFKRVPYDQSRSWHVSATDVHLSAYGQRLVAEAFLAATSTWI